MLKPISAVGYGVDPYTVPSGLEIGLPFQNIWQMTKLNNDWFSIPISPLAILQADHRGKTVTEEIAWGFRQPAFTKNVAELNLLPQWLTEITALLFPFEHCHGWAESWELVLGDTSMPSPQIANVLTKATVPSYLHRLLEYWLLNGRQPDLSTVTLVNCMLSSSLMSNSLRPHGL